MTKYAKMAVVAAVALMSASSQSRPAAKTLCKGFLPINSMRIPVGDVHAAGISQDMFNKVLDNIEKVYGPIIAQKGGRLVVNRLWDDATVNASAEQSGGDWIINMYGGLARHPAVTEEGFALVACHELGHHVGGFPRTGGWATNEGGADYYGTLKCMRRVMPGTAVSGADPGAMAGCKGQFGDKPSQNRCQRGAMAGISLGTLLGELGGSGTPAISTPDPSQVGQTDDSHPAAQCRLDTYFQGALCKRGVGEEQSAEEPNAGACTRKAGFDSGLRPRCWYKPPADEPSGAPSVARHPTQGIEGLQDRIQAMGAVLSGRGV